MSKCSSAIATCTTRLLLSPACFVARSLHVVNRLSLTRTIVFSSLCFFLLKRRNRSLAEFRTIPEGNRSEYLTLFSNQLTLLVLPVLLLVRNLPRGVITRDIRRAFRNPWRE